VLCDARESAGIHASAVPGSTKLLRLVSGKRTVQALKDASVSVQVAVEIHVVLRGEPLLVSAVVRPSVRHSDRG
jgi:hypothetical protein